ncbi:MAG: hypothetical protein AB7G20_03505 [Sulfurimonas sp.]|uniref:hypothetical protein n=1 Tax=Sulfurimonas sp. TaxID=2022749 RepID=UPI003D0AEA62
MKKLLDCEKKYFIKLIFGLFILNIAVLLINFVVPLKQYQMGILFGSLLIVVLSIFIFISKVIVLFFKRDETVNCDEWSVLKRVGSWLSSIV